MTASQRQELEAYLEERFGFPLACWDGYTWLTRDDAPAIWVIGKGPLPEWVPRIEAAGLKAFKTPPPSGYPSNALLRVFGASAARGCFDLADASQLDVFLSGNPNALGRPPEEEGYCIVRLGDSVIGRGEWKDGLLHCHLPKMLRMPQ